MPLKHSEATRKQCEAMTRSGQLCKARPHKDGLCLFHSDPAKAAELGRKGGLRRQRIYEQSCEPVTPPESAADVKRMLAEVMADIRAGKMDPKLGTTLGYLGTSLLKAIETSDIEQRLAKLEGESEPTNPN